MSNFEYKKIIDISISLHRNTVAYPGNPEIAIETIESASGHSFISKIVMGSHSGTHVDAPSHIGSNLVTLDQIPLETFIGACRVIDCNANKESVTVEELQSKNIKAGERILLRTQNSLRGFSEFYSDYTYLSPKAATYLAEQKVALVGIDYLSVKQRGSKDNTPHIALLQKNITILEGLDLLQVSEGEYTLVALPLKFMGLDGAPVRALLLQ